MKEDKEFWDYLNHLIMNSRVMVDRPRGSIHPNYNDMVYPVDYGYLDGTTTNDGDGIDVWVGSEPFEYLKEFICTVDLGKKDVEIKLLLGCSHSEINKILDFHNQLSMRAFLVKKQKSSKGN
jgi:inorganic pyrophosphatase